VRPRRPRAREMRQNFSDLLAATPFALAAASLLSRRRWSFVAGACLVVALALWLTRGTDGAFVAATLGVVAWFWDQRNRLRAIVIETEPDDAQDEDDDFDDTDDDSDDYFEESDESEEIKGADEIDETDATDEETDSDRRERP
jgi:hypothetical protein